ncbi:MAG: hypothetical protein ABIK99_06590 [candidate division WOR-3 bacterium]
MIKVIGERNKIAFFSLFGFKTIHWVKEEKQELIEGEEKLIILDEEIPELEEIVKRGKTFPLLFALYPRRGKGILEKLLWK